MYKATFEIEGISRFFDGYAEETHWNGWSMPWFTRDVAEIIKSICSNDGEGAKMHYDAEKDAYICTFPKLWEMEDEVYVGKDWTINGETLHLYPIGNGCWSWDNLADYQSENSKIVYNWLHTMYSYLKPEQLYEVYSTIIAETDEYMTEKDLKIYTNGFMSAYDRRN